MLHSTNTSDSREEKLPKWVKEKLDSLRTELKAEQEKREQLEAASAILTNRNWFTIKGPKFSSQNTRKLWYLDNDHPSCLCALGRDDILLVGRRRSILGTRHADKDKIQYFRCVSRSYKNGKMSASLDLEIENPDAMVVAVLIVESIPNNLSFVLCKAELELNGFVYHGILSIPTINGDTATFTENR